MFCNHDLEPNIFLRKYKHLTIIVECVLEMCLCNRDILVVTHNCFETPEKELLLHLKKNIILLYHNEVFVNLHHFYTFLNGDSLYRYEERIMSLS